MKATTLALFMILSFSNAKCSFLEASWALKHTLSAHNGFIYSLATLPDGDLASASWDKTIKIWDLYTGVLKRTLMGHKDMVDSLVVLLNGDLASSSHDQTVKIWNATTGSLKLNLIGHTDMVYSLAVLANGDSASC